MHFAEAPGVCGLCLFTYLSAVTAALTLKVHQDRVNGTVGQSVLLPVSYTVPDPHGYLRITWTRGGNASVCVEYTCFSGQECHLNDGRTHITVSEPYKHRALLFPENASLLLTDLQINDSGIYELSISHSTGTEKGNLTLEVRSATEIAIDSRSGTNAGITAATDRLPVIKNEVIIPPVVLAAAVIILCLVVKTRRVCKGSRQKKEEQATTQDHWEPQEGGAAYYTEVGWTPQANAKREMHPTTEMDVYSSVQESSSANCLAVLNTERMSRGITGTGGKKVENPEENVEYDKIWFGK
ncbi:uncharacterized protein LOC132394526 [Hypanus sabinus]|uniref:uncharacterized protein LOC132394526 n=1 Tax=Hypanus sabinus TaxID=79690 RepID=UPI0028C4E5BA|nr:uncharacterized protein LOC132394526 [Hypanus sabinus]